MKFLLQNKVLFTILGLTLIGVTLYSQAKINIVSEKSLRYETSNCKTHTLPVEKVTFSCPSNWKLKIYKSASYFDKVELVSPNDFTITINTGNQPGGGCDYDCQTYNIKNIVLAKLNYYTSPLYVVVHGMKGLSSDRISFSVIEQTTCFDNTCGGYKSKTAQLGVRIQGGYFNDKGTDYKYVDPEIFINSKDVREAVNILKTLHY